jgi:hypothetical protein
LDYLNKIIENLEAPTGIESDSSNLEEKEEEKTTKKRGGSRSR